MKILIENLINNKLYLIIVVTILAVLFSELLIFIQLNLFWEEDKQDVVYWIGFWTPLVDGFFISLLIIYIRSLYEKKLLNKTIFLNQSQKIAHIGSIYTNLKKNKITWSDEVFNILELDYKTTPSQKTFFEYIHPDDKGLVQSNYKNLNRENRYQIEYRLKLDNEKIKYIREICYINFDSSNTPISTITTLQDITKEYEQNLQIRQKDIQLSQQFKLAEMGEMIGNIAHQWRQPLNLISTIASTIKFRSEFEDLKKEYIIENTNQIVEQTKYLSQTIDNFRDFLKDDISLKTISIKETLSKTVSLVEAKLKTHHITLNTKINDELQINANQNELIEAFINILNNSADVLNTKPKTQEKLIFINTSFKEEDHLIEIEFLDNGGGIPEDKIHRILEPYFTTKFESQGTGLGLSITNKVIVERHSGKIDISNKDFTYNGKKYKGACFTIILPNNWNYNI